MHFPLSIDHSNPSQRSILSSCILSSALRAIAHLAPLLHLHHVTLPLPSLCHHSFHRLAQPNSILLYITSCLYLACLRKVDESASSKRNNFSANAAVLISRDPPPSSFSNPGPGISPPPPPSPPAAAATAFSYGEAVLELQDTSPFNMEVHTGFLGAFER